MNRNVLLKRGFVSTWEVNWKDSDQGFNLDIIYGIPLVKRWKTQLECLTVLLETCMILQC